MKPHTRTQHPKNALRRIFSTALLLAVPLGSVNAQIPRANEPPKFITLTSEWHGFKREVMDRDGDGWDDMWRIICRINHRDKTKDTDLDGVTDYEEMILNRDPNVKGPLPAAPLTPEQIAKQKADAEKAEAEHLARMQPKLAAGLLTAARKLPAELKSEWLSAENQKAALADLAQRSAAKEKQQQEAAEQRIPPGPMKELIRTRQIRVQRMDENGLPVLIGPYAIAGADSISTDDLWPGGAATGLPDVKGTGRTVGIWDVDGAPFYEHVEFDPATGPSRIIDGDTDALTYIASHASQVGGVMAAAGTLSGARGMSYESNLKAYSDENDFSETGTAAAAGMTLSNHSYGQYAGWHYFPNFANLQWIWTGEDVAGEDKRFGFYNKESRKVDLVCYNAPSYLPVYASGNDVTDSGPAEDEAHWAFNTVTEQYYLSTTSHPVDGSGSGFDTLTGRSATKNALVVGAVNPVPGGYTGGAVTIAAFSSRGPTDDGRIKPDLVADGVNVITSQLELAQPYEVLNSSFEAAGLSVGGNTYATANWTQNPQSGGWVQVYRLQYNLDENPPVTNDGFNFAGLGTHAVALTGLNTQIYQDLPGVTLQANTNYEITVRFGRYNGFTDPTTNFRVRIYTNGFGVLFQTYTVSAASVPVDQFYEATFPIAVGATPPPGNVRIVLEHGGPNFVSANGNVNFAFFDAVSFRKKHNQAALPTNIYTDGSIFGRGTVSGTSYAAPAVTGSLNLLQEINDVLGGQPLWGSTWKTLAIATADDLGNPGPDYTFGWGLMNTKKAAEMLNQQLIGHSKRSFVRQNVLYDGNTVEYTIQAKGGEDLIVTEGYADVAYQNVTVADENGGIPANTLDNPTSMLINDLDLEVVTPAGTVLGPWLLNPASPSSNATAPAVGNDDDRNNVKQVRIPAASVVANGLYTVRIKRDPATTLRVAKKQTGNSNYELLTSQPGQPAFQRFSVVIRGNVERKEDRFEVTDIERAGNQHYLEWRSIKGVRYQVQTSTDLVNWTDVPGEIDATSELTPLTVTGASSTEEKRFYRVKEVGS